MKTGFYIFVAIYIIFLDFIPTKLLYSQFNVFIISIIVITHNRYYNKCYSIGNVKKKVKSTSQWPPVS